MNWSLWLTLLPLAFVVFSIAWAIQRRTGDAALVDVFWPYSVGLASAYVALFSDGDTARRLLMAILGLLWGIRLGTHILTDRIIVGHEDRRYTQMRDDWNGNFQLLIFRFYQYQAASVFYLASVFLVIGMNDEPLGLWGILSGLVVLIAVVGEIISDQQLQKWRHNPENAGKTCREGLWNYSRHPNYFFEWLVWVGWAMMALTTPGWWWLGLLPAVVMYVAIIYFTGIPPNERQSLISRSDYGEYKKEVSTFFPWFPKSR